jgi:hypothetical protein
MKSLFLLLSLFMVFTAQSQQETFIRIFDDNGKTTHKGSLIKTSDSSLTLSKNKKQYEIPVTKISRIKLRRSIGHTVLISSLVGGALLGIIAAATNESQPATGTYTISFTTETAAIGGFVAGAATGAIAGSIIAGTRKRPEFYVNMKQEQWMKVKPILDSYLPVE